MAKLDKNEIQKLLNALGLQGQTIKEININIEADCIPIITIKKLITDEIGLLSDVVKQYELKKIE